MTIHDPALLRIDRATLRNARPDDHARLAHALDAVTPSSLGLGSRSVLVVRRLAIRTPLPRAGPSDRFIAGLRDDLRARMVTARRGQTGNDEDMLFDDDAEFEAALVVDWQTTGPSPAQRWWSATTGGVTPVTRWRQNILTDVQLLPRVIARLVALGMAEQWLVRFEPGELVTASVRLAEAYRATPAAIASISASTAKETVSGQPARPATVNAKMTLVPLIAPEIVSIVDVHVRLLVSMALVIVRRPTLIGTAAFMQSIVAFAERAKRSQTNKAPSPEAAFAARQTFFSSEPATTSRHPKDLGKDVVPASRSRRAAAAPPEVLPPDVASTYSADPKRIHSHYAGLFFLLNVFLALRLYGDFTRPGDGLKGLSPFELMYLLGKRWFGDGFVADPLATLLIDLAGLEAGTKPGTNFDAPRWAVPDDWLTSWPTDERDALTFPLAEDGAVKRSPSQRRKHWLDNLALYLAARLERALGDSDAVAITGTQPGSIARDRDRIGIRFPLADHPIALRIAGLDRDPGWLPAAAHFIEFSFA